MQCVFLFLAKSFFSPHGHIIKGKIQDGNITSSKKTASCTVFPHPEKVGVNP